MKLVVYILESASYELFESSFENKEISDIVGQSFVQGIDLNGIENLSEKLFERFNLDVEFSFVDKEYHIKNFYTREGKQYHQKIEKLKENHEFNNATWMEFMDHSPDFKNENVYIFCSKQGFLNAYDFANFLQVPLNGNFYFIWGANSIGDCINAKSYYNIFSRTERNLMLDFLDQKQEEDIEAIKWIVEQGVEQVTQLILAGVSRLEPTPQHNVNSWVFNVNSYFSSGIVLEYDLTPLRPDCSNSKIQKGYLAEEFFLISADYRYQILDGMCRVLYKYGREFGFFPRLMESIFNVNYRSLCN